MDSGFFVLYSKLTFAGFCADHMNFLIYSFVACGSMRKLNLLMLLQCSAYYIKILQITLHGFCVLNTGHSLPYKIAFHYVLFAL